MFCFVLFYFCFILGVNIVMVVCDLVLPGQSIAILGDVIASFLLKWKVKSRPMVYQVSSCLVIIFVPHASRLRGCNKHLVHCGTVL